MLQRNLLGYFDISRATPPSGWVTRHCSHTRPFGLGVVLPRAGDPSLHRPPGPATVRKIQCPWNFVELRGSLLIMENEELMAVQRQIDMINARLGQALGRADLAGAQALHAELVGLDRRRTKLLQQATARHRHAAPSDDLQSSSPGPGPGPGPTSNPASIAADVNTGPDVADRPLREVVLDYLHVVGRPVAVQLLADIALAKGGYRLPNSRVASLRRDEERSFRSSATRSAYVVPALTYDRFTAVRGVLASSAWPLTLRLIAPASPRVDFLQTVIALAGDNSGRASAERPKLTKTGRGMELLLRKLARTIPDALDSSHVPLDYDRIVQAAAAELAVHEAADIEERQAAADRARAQLNDPAELLFGHRPTIISNPTRKEA